MSESKYGGLRENPDATSRDISPKSVALVTGTQSVIMAASVILALLILWSAGPVFGIYPSERFVAIYWAVVAVLVFVAWVAAIVTIRLRRRQQEQQLDGMVTDYHKNFRPVTADPQQALDEAKQAYQERQEANRADRGEKAGQQTPSNPYPGNMEADLAKAAEIDARE